LILFVVIHVFILLLSDEIISLNRITILNFVWRHSGTHFAWFKFFHVLQAFVGTTSIQNLGHLNLIFEVTNRIFIHGNDRSRRGFSLSGGIINLIFLIQTIFVFIENSRRILSCVSRGCKSSSFYRTLWMNNDPILVHHLLHLLSIGLLLLLQFGRPIVLKPLLLEYLGNRQILPILACWHVA
jgi:hypothetical protein